MILPSSLSVPRSTFMTDIVIQNYIKVSSIGEGFVFFFFNEDLESDAYV